MPRREQAQTLVEPLEPETSEAAPATWSRYGESPYLLGKRIAAGGMGSIHLGLRQGALGFRRLLAIKRLHPHLTESAELVARFKDEIRLVSRLNHPNVVQTLDVLETKGELALVMEFVDGVTLNQMMKDARAAGTIIPVATVVGVVVQALRGLHAAHELLDEEGHWLELVHRDVSPQNIMIARSGLVKVLDFGIAKATNESHVTRTGHLSGKAPYMSPEQILGTGADRRTDVFSAGIVLWEALTGRRLFRPPGAPESVALRNVVEMQIPRPGELRPEVSDALESIVLRALERDPARRFASAQEFALALEEAVPQASVSGVESSVMTICAARLAHISELVDAGATDKDDAESSLESTTLPVLSKLREPELSYVQGIPSDEPRRPLFRGAPWLGSAVAVGLVIVLGIRASGERLRAVLWEHSAESALATTLGANEPATAATSKPVTATAHKPPAAQIQASEDPQELAEPEKTRKAASARDAGRPAPSGDTALPTTSASRSATSLRRNKLGRNRAAGAVASSERQNEMRRENPRAASSASARLEHSAKPLGYKPRTQPIESVALKPNCSPPTYTDSEGIRHFRPECL